ncbi:MAG: hypothetical protein JST50_08000 [Bacteroidetes bacterium]|jgi:hypothetical protein|nr:hypothetical protein [Bacteroidota bacterium]
MIDPGNGSKWGIKSSNVSFINEIHEIIDNAKQFIIVCGYNFSPFNHPTSIIPRIINKRNQGINALLIMPPRMWGFGNQNHTDNITYLINNNIGVILDSSNHSKWIISDYGYYYGSLNFTAASMTSKTEVVSFCESLRGPNTLRWMIQTKEELIGFAIEQLSYFNTVRATMSLGTANANNLQLLQQIFTQILRYNPSIEKIEQTLLNYENVRLEISSIVDEYFPIVNFSYLNRIWDLANRAIFRLDRLAYVGNDIFLKNEDQSLNGNSVIVYNRIHTNFVSTIGQIRVSLEDNYSESFSDEKLTSLTIRTENSLREFMNNSNG